MKRTKQKRKNNKAIRKNITTPEETLVEIYAEAYYRALSRLEKEKEKSDVEEKAVKSKRKRILDILFILNFIFFPWKINKCFKIKNGIYDSILVLVTAGVLKVAGGCLWIFSLVFAVIGVTDFVSHFTFSVNYIFNNINIFLAGLIGLMFGSVLYIAGSEFSKEENSNRIYAYSASIIALVSCIVGVIALVKDVI